MANLTKKLPSKMTAAVTPSGEKTLLPDVFGNARTAGEVTMGALEGSYADGMAILVR